MSLIIDPSKAQAPPDFEPEGWGDRFHLLIDSVGGVTAAARIARVSTEAIRRWRHQRARPPLYQVAQLCRHAGRSLDWLIWGAEGLRTVVDAREALIESHLRELRSLGVELPESEPNG